MNRRSFLQSCILLATAPAIVRADSLMRIAAAPKIQVPLLGYGYLVDVESFRLLYPTIAKTWALHYSQVTKEFTYLYYPCDASPPVQRPLL